MSRLRLTYLLLLMMMMLVVRMLSACRPAFEIAAQTVFVTNDSRIIGYRLPNCLSGYRLSGIIFAEVINPSTSTSTNVTTILSSALSSCQQQQQQQQESSSCTANITLNGNMASGSKTSLTMAVNFTCDLILNWSPGYLTPQSTVSKNSTGMVAYIRVEMSGYGTNWNCTFSSVEGSAVSWRWWNKNCNAKSLSCVEGNSSVWSNNQNGASSVLCLRPKSFGMIKFLTDTFCLASESFLLDVQVDVNSNFNIQCQPYPPPSPNPPSSGFDVVSESRTMGIQCGGPMVSSSSVHPVSPVVDNGPSSLTPPFEGLPSTTTTATTTTTTALDHRTANAGPVDDGYTTAIHGVINRPIDSLGLGLGLGLSLGLLIILGVALLIIWYSRKRKQNDLVRTMEKPPGITVSDKDGGFVLANDIFTNANIYHEISSSPPSPVATLNHFSSNESLIPPPVERENYISINDGLIPPPVESENHISTNGFIPPPVESENRISTNEGLIPPPMESENHISTNEGFIPPPMEREICISTNGFIPPSTAIEPNVSTNESEVEIGDEQNGSSQDGSEEHEEDDQQLQQQQTEGPSRPSPAQPKTRQNLTLTRKLFTQIAEIAKQEEINERGKQRQSTVEELGNEEAAVMSEFDELVDRWLYSESTLSGINSGTGVSTEGRPYIQPQHEFHI